MSLEQWADEMEHIEISENQALAEGALNKHAELVAHMTQKACLVLQRGQSLLQLFTDTGVQIMADAQYDAVTRVQVLLESLHEKQLDLEDAAEQKNVHIEQVLQLVKFRSAAEQVRGLIAIRRHFIYNVLWLD